VFASWRWRRGANRGATDASSSTRIVAFPVAVIGTTRLAISNERRAAREPTDRVHAAIESDRRLA
jgi:hypothetical protein